MTQATQQDMGVSDGIPHGLPAITIGYTNWRGEYAERQIVPMRVWFGSTEWHPEPQWLLTAWDEERDAARDFAVKDIGLRTATPAPEWQGMREALLDSLMGAVSRCSMHTTHEAAARLRTEMSRALAVHLPFAPIKDTAK